MTILEAIADANLFRSFYGDTLESWRPWLTALSCLYGLPVQNKEGEDLVQLCTGREAVELPEDGFRTGLFLVGRRGGKSRGAAVIGGFEALFGGHEQRLAKGETGIIPVISPSRFQSTIVWKYLNALFEIPMLKQEVIYQNDGEKILRLRNGIEIRILTGDWRTVRGPAVVCAILDELCFFGYTDESKVRSDTELVRAIRPALMTTKGRLIGISSRYARRGYAYDQFKKYHGSNRNDNQFAQKWRTLVWSSDSMTMNPTLSQEEIDQEFEEDPVAARSEFGWDWREDIAEFVPRSLIESLVIEQRKELMPSCRFDYRAGCDLSGGRADSATLCIIHKEDKKIVEDLIREWKAPFNPYAIVREIAAELKRFGLTSLQGDNYAGEWPVAAFKAKGIRYRMATKSKSDLYRELLPVLCGGKESIELLNQTTQTNQLAGLERRTRSGGRDIIDHPTHGKDDVANALAVACDFASTKVLRIGGLRLSAGSERTLNRTPIYDQRRFL